MEDHPERNWGVILHKAWLFCLKEKVGVQQHIEKNNHYPRSDHPKKGNGKICYKYNLGKCTYGFGCKFEHKCGVCQKFGHGANSCRKLGRQGCDSNERKNFSIKLEPEENRNK